MARQTVIDWQKDGVLVAVASGRAGRISLDSVSHHELDMELGESHSDALSRAAGELKLGKGNATLIAARDFVEVRTISVPRVDAAELPGIIRFQAQRQLANMGDSWTLDYVMLPSDGQEMQTALVGALAPEHLKKMEAACTRCGLQLDQVALRPIEIARHAVHASSIGNQTALMVCVSEGTADLIIAQGGKVVMVRNTNLPTEGEHIAGALSGEIRRSLLAASSQLGGKSIENAVLMCSADLAPQIEQAVADATGMPVTVIDLTTVLPAGLDTRTTLANQQGNRLAGMCGAATLAAADKSTTLDFKNPKKAPPKKSKAPTYIMLGVAATVLIACGVGYWIYLNNSLDTELAGYEQANKDKKALIELANSRMSQVSAVEAFAKASPNYLDALLYITENAPESKEFMLAGPQFTTLTGGEGQVRINVAGNSSGSIGKFEESVRDENHEVKARNPRESSRPTNLYKWEATELVTITNLGWKVLNTVTSVKQSEKQAGEASEEGDVDASAGGSEEEENEGTNAQGEEQPESPQPSEDSVSEPDSPKAGTPPETKESDEEADQTPRAKDANAINDTQPGSTDIANQSDS